MSEVNVSFYSCYEGSSTFSVSFSFFFFRQIIGFFTFFGFLLCNKATISSKTIKKNHNTTSIIRQNKTIIASPAPITSAPAVNKPTIASIIPTIIATIASTIAAINSMNSHLLITPRTRASYVVASPPPHSGGNVLRLVMC